MKIKSNDTSLENRKNNRRKITSDEKLRADEINHHFRVFAGPGAGKTYWLVEHIKNVLANSGRLRATSKIACITYTVVAAEQIKGRLEMSADAVEVSTIHSFLYKNIVKPYAFLIKDDNGDRLINVEKLDGHGEHKPSYKKMEEWINKIPERKKYLWVIYGKGDERKKNQKNFKRKLIKLFWEIDSVGHCKIAAQDNSGFPNDLLQRVETYKSLYWKEGIIHHDDVLYLSHRILKENPLLLKFIGAKFPYIFLDEFQDTNPIQTRIVEWLSENGTFVGVIGDSAQAIFQFNGARRDDFENFDLPGQRDYEIIGNRRSSNKIIRLLNYLRENASDQIQQEQEGRDFEGEEVFLLVSEDINKIVTFFNEQTVNNTTRCILARENKHVSALKSKGIHSEKNPWDDINDPDRYMFLNSILSAAEYAFQKRFDVAVKEIVRAIRTDEKGKLKKPLKNRSKGEFSKFEKQSAAVPLLEYLIKKRKISMEQTLFDFYNRLASFISEEMNIKYAKIGKGKFEDAAGSIYVKDLIAYLNLPEEINEIRTVHKAKGGQFDSVLLYFDKSENLRYILDPDIEHEDDEHRIVYVALSRAKDKLFISVKSLNEKDKQKIEALGLAIKFLD